MSEKISLDSSELGSEFFTSLHTERYDFFNYIQLCNKHIALAKWQVKC